MYEWLRNKWRIYYKPTYRIVAFVISIIIIVLFFPNTGKFKYEYELGRPWRYDNLIAPFDFPIYKADAELSRERDSIMHNFVPYFKRDSVSAADIEQNVTNFIDENRSDVVRGCGSDDVANKVLAHIKTTTIKVLSDIYSQGVILLPDGVQTNTTPEYEFMLITGNVAEPYALSEVQTIKNAYQTLANAVSNSVLTYGNTAYNVVRRLPFNSLLNANITQDNERTETEKNSKLVNLVQTRGKFMAGQRIIGTGDIVDEWTSIVIESLKKVYDTQYDINNRSIQIFAGQTLVVICLMITLFLFLSLFRRDVFKSLHSINFILLIMLLMIVGASLMARQHWNISFVIPFTVLPIFLRLFLDSRLAMYTHVVTMLIVSFWAYNRFQFLLLHIPAGMIAIMCLNSLSRRGQILRTAVLVVVYYIIMYSGIRLWQTGEVASINVNSLGMFAINGLFILLSYPLIYVFERMFGFLSDVTLLELSDTNSPLLRQLAEKAPGTFHHSMQVSTLAQEVAFAIDANAMLVRAGAMYHDIGKMVSPMFFTENQTNNINPHDELTYEQSAAIVLQHVKNGIKIAKKHNIPSPIIDFIATHQGTTFTKFFLVSWQNANPDKKVNDELFRYPGPTPFTKETAILMMADAIEASSRSLKQLSDSNIDNLVEKIIDTQITEHQFDLAPITFKEIHKAKKVFKNRLKNIYHARVQYPELLK